MSSSGNRLLMSALAMVTILGGACGGGGRTVEVTGAWARSSPAAVTTGAVYMNLTASQADRLLSVSVSPDIADQAQIHEVVAADHTTLDQGDDTDHEAMDQSDDADHDAMHEEEMGSMSEVMTMRELTDGLELPANTTVELAPGGYHIMLIDLVEPLDAGDSFEVDLSFEGGTETVTVTVADRSP